MMDDDLDLLREIGGHSAGKPKNCKEQQEPFLPKLSEKQDTGGRLCFVITQNKSSSWVEDLYDCISVTERTRVYN
jgi:hypothetical protein